MKIKKNIFTRSTDKLFYYQIVTNQLINKSERTSDLDILNPL
jgi:hypothetical protein